MLEKDALFSDSNRKLKYLTPLQPQIFWTKKFHENSWIFHIQFPILQKKVIEKNFFSESPLCNSKVIFWIFEKNWFFWFFFVQIYTFIKKVFFYVFFWKILKIFGKLKYLTPLQPQIFLTFFGFGEKRVFNREWTFFFVFQKQKNAILHPYGGGGGQKVHFSKSTFWITSREKKSPLFSKTLSYVKG